MTFAEFFTSAIPAAIKSAWARVRLVRAPIQPIKPAVAPRPKQTAPSERDAYSIGSPRKEAEEVGRFYFKGDILDQLDRYFLYLRRLRKIDREMYAMCGRLGAAVIPKGTLAEHESLSPYWLAGKRPFFGAVAALGKSRAVHRIEPQFWMFMRMTKAAPQIEPAIGTCYRVIAYFDDEKCLKKFSHGHPMEYYVDVRDDGRVVLLRELVRQRASRIWSKTERRFVSIPTMEPARWQYPPDILDIAREHGEDPASSGEWLFRAVANFYEEAHLSTVRVNCHRGGIVASFGVDMRRTAYFFRDRESAIVVNGRRSKIFHAVKSHERTLASGKVTPVRFHFRGEREFDWNGYKVVVSVPGRGGTVHLPDVDFGGAYDVTVGEYREGFRAAQTVARIFAPPRPTVH